MYHRYFQAPGVAATVVLLATLMAACALPALLSGGFVSPDITLQDSKVESMSLSVATVSFGVNVHNPNPYALSVREVHYRVLVAGSALAAGETPGVTFPARGAGTIDLPAEIRLDALAAAAPSARMLGEIPYELEVTLSVGALWSRREIRFAAAGVMRLDLPMGLASAAGRFALAHAGRQR